MFAVVAADLAADNSAQTQSKPMTTRWKHYAGIALKTLSWRATAGIDTFVLTFLIMGNLAAAAAVAGTEGFTKFALFYCHEWLWQRKKE
jgi:uncharacterized membrane protein